MVMALMSMSREEEADALEKHCVGRISQAQLATGSDAKLSVRDNFWFSAPVTKKMLKQVIEVREAGTGKSRLGEMMFRAFCSV